MLITCFQCRQPLDVPLDAGGKRIHCPHCEYVIVVPVQAKSPATDFGSSLATGLPVLELDEAAPSAKPRSDAIPLPPMPIPHENHRFPAPADESAMDDLPAAPSIDMKSRRRWPGDYPPRSRNRRGVIFGVGAVGVLILIGVVAGLISSSKRQRPAMPKVAVHAQPPPMQIPPPVRIEPFVQPNFPVPPLHFNLPWQDFHSFEHRFKAQFPGVPVKQEKVGHLKQMTVFEVKNVEWEFAIAHRVLTDHEFKTVTLENRLRGLQDHLRETYGGNFVIANTLELAGGHKGKEWEFSLTQNGKLGGVFAQTFYVREGNSYHHYLLSVKVTSQVFRGNVQRFFMSFQIDHEADPSVGQRLAEFADDPLQGGRRDNEFTALALHPNGRLAFVASSASQFHAISIDGPPVNLQFEVRPGKSIDQIAIAHDGKRVAVASDGEVQYWDDPQNLPLHKTAVPGLRCAFTKEHRLLVASRTDIQEYIPPRVRSTATLSIADLDVKGLAISPDGATVAVHSEKSIALYNWSEKKFLGRIDAHDEPITAVVFSPDGNSLASASIDRTIKLWNVADQTLRATLKQHAWSVWSLAFTPDGKRLASGGLDGMVLLWDVELETPSLVFAQSYQFPVRALAFDTAGKNCYLVCKQAVGVDNNGPRRYVRQLRRIPCDLIHFNQQDAERTLAQSAGLHLPTTMMYLTRDGRQIVTTTDSVDAYMTPKSLRVWDGPTAKLKYAHDMSYRGVLSPDGQWFAYANPESPNQMNLLDVTTNRISEKVLAFPTPEMPMLFFAADSKSIWMQRKNQMARYEVQRNQDGSSGLTLRNSIDLRKPGEVRAIQVHPSLDHKSFVVERNSVDGVQRSRTVHSSANGKEIKPNAPESKSYLRLRRPMGVQVELFDFLNGSSTVIGQQRQNMLVSAIDPDGNLGLTGEVGADQRVRVHLWDLKSRRPILTIPDKRGQTITGLRFSPDGGAIAFVTGAGYTRIAPLNWLLERKALLPCNPNEVSPP